MLRHPEHQSRRYFSTTPASSSIFQLPRCMCHAVQGCVTQPLLQAVMSSKQAFLHLMDPGFACGKEIDNMCTFACSTGFFASEKGHSMQLNLRLVRDVLVFYPEANRSQAIFTLPLLHAQSVQLEDSFDHPSSSCVVSLLSQFRQCVMNCHEASIF